jgi:arginyl-tRNA synthetase
MDIKGNIEILIQDALQNLGIEAGSFVLEHPTDMKMGDYSTSVAMAHAKKVQMNPKELAQKIQSELEKNLPTEISKVEVAGPGFINFYLSREFFTQSVQQVGQSGETWGKNDALKGKKFFVEHTQPNPFKEFHIGHLMNNAVGESIARIVKSNGADIKTATYHGDVGLHIAMSIWAIMKGAEEVPVGKAYAYGYKFYESDETAKAEIIEINKKIYNKTDETVNELYNKGRQISLEYFESIYKRFDNYFDYHFYESEAGPLGKELVLENLGKVFKEGEKGAVIFEGESFEPKTHTRVFLNSEGLPTYEAKEVGLAKIKKDLFQYDESITITANEQDAFFSVVEVAIGEVFPDIKGKLHHVSHGLLKLPSGKMSSRTGTIISAESLISQVEEKVFEKIKDRDFSDDEKKKLAEIIAIGSIKYSILRSSLGTDIIFDFEKSISFEGDSGPYLQYTAVRANSILKKAADQGISIDFSHAPAEVSVLEKLLYQFPEVVLHAYQELEPHHITTYLTELASAFNSFYANTIVLNSDDSHSGYRVAIVSAFYQTMKNGLYLLGIQTPEKM